MDDCWLIAGISVALPSAVGGYLLRDHAEYWGYILLGWGVTCLALLSALAGTDLVIPTTKEIDLFTRIRDAFTEVCGPAPFAFSFIGGGIAGYLVGEATKSTQP